VRLSWNWGKWKFYFDRWTGYVARPVQILNIATFIIVSGVSWWWIVAGFVLSALFMIVDAKFIAPKEYEFISEVNPWMRNLLNEVKK
jgi:hypothetical protein